MAACDVAQQPMQKIEALQQFAARHDLLYRREAPAGRPSDSYIYSHDMRYRYAFARWWSAEGPVVLWVGVNPGKGDTEQRRRPTLERCISWSQVRWRAAGLIFANLFAARHNKPTALRHTPDPVGPYNDAALTAMSAIADHTVVAWGNLGGLHGRAAEVVKLLRQPQCLGVTAAGQPRHPLYVPHNTALVPWHAAVGHRA